MEGESRAKSTAWHSHVVFSSGGARMLVGTVGLQKASQERSYPLSATFAPKMRPPLHAYPIIDPRKAPNCLPFP